MPQVTIANTSPESPLVFVYGTLKSSMSAAYMMEDCQFIGVASTPGVLLHLNAYPGLVKDPASICRVSGEVYKIMSPEKLHNLDGYEGTPHLYKRHQIATPYGRAWAYFYQHYDTVNAQTVVCDKGMWLNGASRTTYENLLSYWKGAAKVHALDNIGKPAIATAVIPESSPASSQQKLAASIAAHLKIKEAANNPDSNLILSDPLSTPKEPVIVKRVVPDRPQVGPGWEYG